MTCEHKHDSALYVLGVLSPEERVAFERHLDQCPECRAEMADFDSLPGLLGRLDLATAQAIAAADSPGTPGFAGTVQELGARQDHLAGSTESRWAGPTHRSTPAPEENAPDNVVPLVLNRVRSRRVTERRRRRWQTAGTSLAAACLALIAVIGVQFVNRPSEPTLTAMETVAANSPVVAQVALESMTGGTKVTLKCQYHGANRGRWSFRMVVVPKKGETESIGSWSAGFGDEVTYPAYTRFQPAEIARIELTKADGTTLLASDVK